MHFGKICFAPYAVEHGCVEKRFADDGIEFDFGSAGVLRELNWLEALQLHCPKTSFESERPPRLLRPHRGALD